MSASTRPGWRSNFYDRFGIGPSGVCLGVDCLVGAADVFAVVALRPAGGHFAVERGLGRRPVRVAAYARSLTDDLAISSLVLLGWLTLQRLGVLKPLAASPRLIMLLVFAALALTLYPATLGLTYFDPYRWGFNPRPMIIMVAVIALALICLRNALGVAMLTFATLAFTFRLKPSENYWDYLIDPLLALYCCGALLSLAVRFVYRRTTGQRRSAALSAGNV